MGEQADLIFNSDLSGLNMGSAWLGMIAYTFQIYFDFSGYSDMAIGLGLLFNIKLPINFNSPYKATSIIDFWRRWHITLSRFLRDYLYFPLGGNRKGEVRRYQNLFITMILGGLWHGAGWTFVAWGALHGCYLIINHTWLNVRAYFGWNTVNESPFGNGMSRMLTLLAVIVGWVFFRAETFSGAWQIIAGMSGKNGAALPNSILEFAPFLGNFATGYSRIPLLAGGTLTGLFEMIGLYSIGIAIICMPNMGQTTWRTKLVAVILTFYFTIQGILFEREPSEFLYFQF